jgi:predicted enzyme related to lactoylglutathione lyase
MASSLATREQLKQTTRVANNTERLVTVVFTVSDLDRTVKLYSDGFGLDLHVDDHQGDDIWITGRHAATSWIDGAFIHFALYESKDGSSTTGAQIAFRVGDLNEAHHKAVNAGAEVIHGPKPQPWGTSARYRDNDGNIIELTESD